MGTDEGLALRSSKGMGIDEGLALRPSKGFLAD
jgi:hypothetical protein